MNRMRVLMAALLGAGMMVAATSFAEEDSDKGGSKGKDRSEVMKERAEAHFKKMDADENGKVSLEEFTTAATERRAAMKEKMKEKLGDKYDEEKAAEREAKAPKPEEIFKKMDADEDGSLTMEEMMEAHKKHRGERGRGRKGHRGGRKAQPEDESEKDDD